MSVNPRSARLKEAGRRRKPAEAPARETPQEGGEARRIASRVGFWAALLSGLLALAWGATMAVQNVISPAGPWAGMEAYARSYDPIEMLNLIPSLPLASTFLVLMTSIHYYAPPAKRYWSALGLAFAGVYAVLASANYLIQFIVVRPALLSGQTEGLALFVMGNPRSLFTALANSYAYMSLSMLFAAWVFGQGRRERWVRWIFVVVGATAPIQFAYTLFNLDLAVALPVGVAWVIGVPLACFLLAALFRNVEM